MTSVNLQKGIVKDVLFNFQQGPSPLYTLNKITFTNNYVAYEKNETKDEKSSFRPGEEFYYEITHPGRTGRPDWIKANRVVSAELALEQRDVLIICQNSMKCAAEVVSGMLSNSNIPKMKSEEVMTMMEQLSINITISTIENAKKIMGVKNYV